MRRLLILVKALIRPYKRLVNSRTRKNETGQKIFLNTVPKSGTHLLTRCLDLFPSIYNSEFHINHLRLNDEQIISRLEKIHGGGFITAHLPYSKKWKSVLVNDDFKMILMIRDPRDILISRLHYKMKKRVLKSKGLTYKWMVMHPDDETRIIKLITGDTFNLDGMVKRIVSIDEYISDIWLWNRHGSHTVRFENLIGEKGGGDGIIQRDEICKLADFLSINLSSNEIKRISNNVYNPGSGTFRKGIIGDWKNHFTDTHKQVFKERAGDLLIELGYEQDNNW